MNSKSGRRAFTKQESEEKISKTRALFALARMLECETRKCNITAARKRLEARLYIGGKKDGKTWQRYELGKRNASPGLLTRVAREIYKLQYTNSERTRDKVPGPLSPPGVPISIWFGNDPEKNHVARALKDAEAISYVMPAGLIRLAQSLRDAVDDDELMTELDTGIRAHRHHYYIASEMLGDLQTVLGYEVIYALIDNNRYEDMQAECDYRDSGEN